LESPLAAVARPRGLSSTGAPTAALSDFEEFERVMTVRRAIFRAT